jgi:hypothetical protein
MMEKIVKEFTGRKTECSLEEGSQHHNFIGVGGGDLFILGRMPLEYDTTREKMISE